jgi:Mn2+/Fe2+ NRAMP family transporter
MGALIAVATLLWQDKQICFERSLAKFYLAATVLTAASALGIYRHGGPNAAHGLAVLTVLAVFVGIAAGKMSFLGGAKKYFVALCFSSTILFHLLPTATEILTRFPMDAPLVGSLEDPLLLKTFAAIVVVFVIMLGLQMNWLRGQRD